MFGLTPSFLKSIGKHPGLNDKGGDPPPAPDYSGAAQQTSAGNLQLAKQNTLANRVDQNTPWGNQNYTQNDDGTWTLDTTLAPAQQQLLDIQNQTSLGLGGSINAGLGRVNDMMATGLDTSKLPNMPTTADNAGRDAMTANLLERMQPSLDRNRNQTETQLLVQGHNRGGEAWNAKQDDLNRAENDARMAAVNAGGAEQSRMFGLGTQARQNSLAEQQTIRNEPLNTLSALRTGAQVQNPQFSNVAAQQGVAGPDYLGAASAKGNYDQGIYNAQSAGNNAMNSGLFGLGNAAIGAWSDRRLKKNIHKIGMHIKGIGLYVFEYIWSPEKHIGVMADEVLKVMPDAVEIQPSGFYKVNYAKLEGV